MALSSSDLLAVYGLLEKALSQDESLRKSAESALAACESKPGFCSLLLEIMASTDINVNSSARWLALVYLKNSVNRYWRLRRDSVGVSDTEKVYLRKKLLDVIREENSQIAVQLALVICKIARFDYPKEWPDLFAVLVHKLQSNDILLTQRVYMVLNQVLKELSTKRLVADQKNLMQDRSILDNVVTFYEAVEWARQTEQPSAIMLLDFEKAYDKVDWGFLEGTLSRMGFPDAWIRGIFALYRSASVAVTIGGHDRRTFTLSRSVRQGYPLAPYLFSFFAETMALYLRGRTPQIQGLPMPIDGSPDLVEQEYVDDTMIFCQYDSDTLDRLQSTLCFNFSACQWFFDQLAQVIRFGAVLGPDLGPFGGLFRGCHLRADLNG
ncbi:hypothetical protein L7F22_012086 [Adiantum nelumboides]|nr:hypothetical protein [Adiantum nelumboides]